MFPVLRKYICHSYLFPTTNVLPCEFVIHFVQFHQSPVWRVQRILYHMNWLVQMTPHHSWGFSNWLFSQIGAPKVQKSTVFKRLKTFLASIKLAKSTKTMSFFEKVIFFVHSCHKKTLVIPENEKHIFGKQCFTTKFWCCDTTFLTKIATVLDVWTLTFQCFSKTFEISIFKTCSCNLRLQGNFRKQCFWHDLTPFWLLFDFILSRKHTGPSWGTKNHFWKSSFHDWIPSSWHRSTD